MQANTMHRAPHTPSMATRTWRLALVALLPLACSAGPLAPRADMAFHLLESPDCTQCLQLHYRDRPLHLGKPIIVATDLASASAATDENGFPTLELRFSADATERISRLTRENLGKRVALLIDGTVVTELLLFTPLSDMLTISGLSSRERDELLSRLTGRTAPAD